MSQPGRLSPAGLDFLRAAYSRLVARTDRMIGRLIDRLDELELLDRTTIVITADHGEQFLEHGTLMHGGGALYNEVLHIPFIVSARGDFPTQKVVATPISTIDFAPTILALLGIKPPRPFQGRRITGEGDNVVVASHGATAKLVTRKWSYIYSAKDGREELYNLVEDPGETQNLAGDSPKATSTFQGALRAQLNVALQHEYVTDGLRPESIRMSDAVKERLRALGYPD